MTQDEPRLLKVATKPWIGRFAGQTLGSCLGAGLVLYSIFLYSGYKEEHMNHWVWAALLFGFVGSSLSRETIVWDVLFVSGGLAALTAAGQVYWFSQGLVASDFSFENEYATVYPWLWGGIGFGLGRVIRWFRRRV